MALAMESAAVNTAQLNAAAHDSTPCVNKVIACKHSTRKWEKKPPAQNRQKPCFRCDKTSHSADECHYKDAQCRYCRKDGHIMSNCFEKQKAEKGKRNRTHQLTAPIQDCVPSEHTGATYNMFSMTGPCPDPIVTQKQVDGKTLLMEVAK